jgi:phosphatidyl-myo-inositol dimannoside synthase
MSARKILCITNDFGPRAGGIETFVIGLIERLPKNSVVVYTSSQEGSAPFDQAWLQNYGVEVIRDRSLTLLPSLRVGRAVRALVRQRQITRVFFGAAAPLGLLSHGLRRAGVERIIALTHGHEVWWAKVWPFSVLLRRIGAGVDHLTFLGEFTGRSIAKALSPRAQRAMVKIAPGIDTNHFAPHSGAIKLRSDLKINDKKVICKRGTFSAP